MDRVRLDQLDTDRDRVDQLDELGMVETERVRDL